MFPETLKKIIFLDPPKNKKKLVSWTPRGSQSGGIGPRSDFEKNMFFLLIFHLGPLDLYKPPFKRINRPWDLSGSIELGQIYIFVDLELHSAYLIPIHAQKV